MPNELIHETEVGANAWSICNIDFSRDSTLPDCVPSWFLENRFPCAIPIHAMFFPASELGAEGLADLNTNTIYVDSTATGLTFEGIVAHEVGHCVFESGDHLPVGSFGIMNAYVSDTIIPTQADLEYASLHTHGWCH